MAAPKQLLVEGTDDYHVILNLQGSRGIRILDKKQIHDLQGVENLLESLPVRIRASEGGAVGAVLDADTSLADRWRGIRDRMERLGYTDVPADPAPEGTILMPPAGTLLPRVGIWLMPDNSTSGILEDFLRFLVPPEDRLIKTAEQTIDHLPDKRFPDKDRSKALMHTWLAWREEPGKPFGQAITARYLDADVPLANVFIQWLQTLFAD